MDKILIDPEVMNGVTRKLNNLSDSLSSCARDVGRIRLNRDTGAEVRVSVSSYLNTTGSRLSAQTVSLLVNATQRALNSVSSEVDQLAKSVKKAEDKFEQCERSLVSMVNDEETEAGPESIAAKIAAIIASFSIPLVGIPAINTATGAGKSIGETIISNKARDLRNGLGLDLAALLGASFVKKEDGTTDVYFGSFLFGTYSASYSCLSREDSFSGSIVNVGDFFKVGEWERSNSAEVKVLDFKGKDKPVKWDEVEKPYTKHTENGKEVTGDKKMDADPFKKRQALLTTGGEAAFTASILSLSGDYTSENGKGTASASVDVGKVDISASYQAGLYAQDGSLSPGLEAKAGASFTVLESNVSGEYEIVDGVKVGGDVTATVGKANAEAEIKMGIVNGEVQMYAGAKAEAIAAEIKGDVYADVAGIKVKGEAGVNVGVGAHAEVGYHDGVVVVDVGASLGLGVTLKGEVDISGIVDTVAGSIDTVKEVGGAIVDKVCDFGGDVIDFGKGVCDTIFSWF